MKNLSFKKNINAAAEDIFSTLTSKNAFVAYGSEFSFASTFDGKMDAIGQIDFFSLDGYGVCGRIDEVSKNEHIRILFIDELYDFKPQATLESKFLWQGVCETYTLKSISKTQTELTVTISNLADNFAKEFEQSWPKALDKLALVCEGGRLGSILVEASVLKPRKVVFETYFDDKKMQNWCFADTSWCCPFANHDLKIGGRFVTRMEAKDRSSGFDLTGTYTEFVKDKMASYRLDGEDARRVAVGFRQISESETKVYIIFESEKVYPEEFQRQGWQAVLNNFKTFCESEQC